MMRRNSYWLAGLLARQGRWLLGTVSSGLILIASSLWCRAAADVTVQFDVFPGYDYIVPEACWFPVVCEIKNNGPSFNGIIEISGGTYNPGQTRRALIELPTGTLKRITIPVFSAAANYSSWDVRLLDERGRVRGEQTQLRARRQIASGT